MSKNKKRFDDFEYEDDWSDYKKNDSKSSKKYNKNNNKNKRVQNNEDNFGFLTQDMDDLSFLSDVELSKIKAKNKREINKKKDRERRNRDEDYY